MELSEFEKQRKALLEKKENLEEEIRLLSIGYISDHLDSYIGIWVAPFGVEMGRFFLAESAEPSGAFKGLEVQILAGNHVILDSEAFYFPSNNEEVCTVEDVRKAIDDMIPKELRINWEVI